MGLKGGQVVNVDWDSWVVASSWCDSGGVTGFVAAVIAATEFAVFARLKCKEGWSLDPGLCHPC